MNRKRDWLAIATLVAIVVAMYAAAWVHLKEVDLLLRYTK